MSNILIPDFLIAAVGYLIYLIMSVILCKKYFRACLQKEIFFVALSFVSATELNIAVQYAPDLYLLFSALWQAAFITFILVFFDGSKRKKFFTACVLILTFILISNFTTSILSAFTLFLNHFQDAGTEEVLSEFENSAIEAASYGASVVSVCLLYQNFDGFLWGDREKWYAAASAPLVFIIAAFDLVNWGASCGIMVRSGGEAGIYLDQIYSYGGFAAFAAICALGATACVYFANKAYVEQQRNLRYNAQIAVYKTLTEQYSRTERLRHDMKNHIIALNALFKGKEWDKMGSYLKNMEARGTEKAADLTGNLAVDALLYQKKKTADDNGIEWECSVKIPKNITAAEFDLCVIFGNILDNALEACEKRL